MHKVQADGAKAKEVLNFFDWALKNGQKLAAELDYVPMPDNVVGLIQDSWKASIKDGSGKAIW
jgi:phosphate transport system substrate-binding protein